MDWLDYREKLGIGFDDETKFKFFLTNITTVLKDRKDLSSQITPKEYYKFCLMTGTSMKSDFYEFECYDFVINTVFRHSEKLSDFIAYYIAFINCQDDASYKNLKKEELKNLICNLMCDAHIKYDILEESGNYFIFPKGAKELDDALVSEPLDWLKDYPQAHKTYCIALKQYADGIYIRDVADNLRKALEDFLRGYLGNNNDLNKNKKEVENHLKSQNVEPHLITILCALLNHYYLLNNEVAKHNDKMDKKYLEFLLYQTGIFIRTLILLK
ncbi:MAG: hypothetical protein IKB88_00205 [Clostridia bacterium]|nr:hypothetical protein [Clostridia bacterium]